jgi:hypothetical protein
VKFTDQDYYLDLAAVADLYRPIKVKTLGGVASGDCVIMVVVSSYTIPDNIDLADLWTDEMNRKVKVSVSCLFHFFHHGTVSQIESFGTSILKALSFKQVTVKTHSLAPRCGARNPYQS